MRPKQLIHRLLTFLILFCVSFLCFLFVCLCLLFLPFSLPVPSSMPTLSERVFAIGPK